MKHSPAVVIAFSGALGVACGTNIGVLLADKADPAWMTVIAAIVPALAIAYNAVIFADPGHLYGWQCWFRALYMARTKKRGAGRQPWRFALRQAECDRWIVDGQMRGAKPPNFIRGTN